MIGVLALVAPNPIYAGGTANGGVPTELVPEEGTPVVTPPPVHPPSPPANCRFVTVGVEQTPSRTVMSTGFAADCCCGVNAYGVPITVPGGTTTRSVMICD
jgi:hypothetical protein